MIGKHHGKCPLRRGRPPKAEGKDTYNEILRVAIELFAKRGFDNTSVREIAQQLGIGQSALYVHFKNKQDILDQLFSVYGPNAALEVLDSYFPEGKEDLPSPAVLPKIMGELIDFYSQREAILLKEILLRSLDPEHQDYLRKRILYVRVKMKSLFQHWVGQGYLKDDFPIEVLLWDLMAIIPVIRLLFQTYDSTPKQLAEARRIAVQHAELFVARNCHIGAKK